MRLGPVLLDLFMSRRRRALRRPELDWLNGSSMTHAGWWPTVGDTLTVVAIESGIDHDIHRPTTTRVAAFTVAAKQNKGEWNEITGPSFFAGNLFLTRNDSLGMKFRSVGNTRFIFADPSVSSTASSFPIHDQYAFTIFGGEMKLTQTT